jgi:hypothetical protein
MVGVGAGSGDHSCSTWTTAGSAVPPTDEIRSAGSDVACATATRDWNVGEREHVAAGDM